MLKTLVNFTKKDLVFSLSSGLITGIVASFLFDFLKFKPVVFGSWKALIVIIPIVWVIGVFIGSFVASKIKFLGWLFQFSKFIAVGFLNTIIDLGVLNLLIAWTGRSNGLSYSGFKAVSFLVAVFNSYFWNKYWTYKSGQEKSSNEFLKYFIVTFIGFLLNVGVSSLIVNLISPKFGLSPELWANVGAVFGTATNLVWNFLGYKIVVFKQKQVNL